MPPLAVCAAPSTLPITTVWSDTEAAWFARCQARSDGPAVISAGIRSIIGPQTELLDIGAGTGVLGAGVLSQCARHDAIEPNAWLARMLQRRCQLGLRRSVVASPWQHVLPDARWRRRTVLCANIPGLVDEAAQMWPIMRAQATHHLVWVVPAQAGPRSWCLAGFLPPELHGADTTPGVDLTLRALADVAPTPHRHEVSWTWRGAFASRQAAVRWFAARIPDGDDPQRRASLAAWCGQYLRRQGRAWIAEAPKRSAILTWNFPESS